MNLMLADNTSFRCVDVFIRKAKLLQDLIYYCETAIEAIPVPDFISRTILKDITSIITNPNDVIVDQLEPLYLVEIIRTTDFLHIDDLISPMTKVLLKKVSNSNCMSIFQKANTIPCLQDVVQKCANMMIPPVEVSEFDIEQFSQKEDSSFINCNVMSIDEIQKLVFLTSKRSTVVKILIVSKWWRNNFNMDWKENVLEILDKINQDACYIPRQQILFMRGIRDIIKTEIYDIERLSTFH